MQFNYCYFLCGGSRINSGTPSTANVILLINSALSKFMLRSAQIAKFRKKGPKT